MVGLQISNNSIQLSDLSLYPGGISVFYAVGAIIRGNTFLGGAGAANEGAAVALRVGAVNAEVSQNVVSTKNLKSGVLLQTGVSGATIHDNQFDSTGIGINVLSGATNNNIGCNLFVTNGTNSSDNGLGTIFTCSSH
jgi:nitrous oxidase accessory protein NosD